MVLVGLALLAPVLSANSIQQTTNIINDCEKRSNKFKKTLDKALGHDNVRAGQAREDQLNNDADRLENAMDKVGDSWNKDHSIQKTRAYVTAAIANGNDINRAMRTWKMGGDAETEWAALRNELNNLARTFGVPGIR
jgi:hypothetical protein